jgi:hypothetical protein
MPLAQARAIRALQQQFIHLAPPAPNHHGQALELRVAQQFDRCEKGIHIEMGDAAQPLPLALWRGASCGLVIGEIGR